MFQTLISYLMNFLSMSWGVHTDIDVYICAYQHFVICVGSAKTSMPSAQAHGGRQGASVASIASLASVD